jgi:hypothetical protein
VRRVKEGTSCTLVQSGYDNEWWPDVMDCYCFLRNTVDILANDSTAYKARFGEDFRGPIIPCGAEITYQPISDKDKKRCHQMGQKVLSGIFLGYIQHAGGGWANDLQIIDWDEIDTAEHKSDVYPKRFKAGEIKVVTISTSLLLQAN